MDPATLRPLAPAYGRMILGSLLSALVGWIPVGIFFSGSLFGFSAALVYACFFALPAWLLFLVPYCLVPTRSVLWRWPVCTLCGAAAGGVIMAVLLVAVGEERNSGLLVALAALVGAVNCLFGSLTRPFFRPSPSA